MGRLMLKINKRLKTLKLLDKDILFLKSLLP